MAAEIAAVSVVLLTIDQVSDRLRFNVSDGVLRGIGVLSVADSRLRRMKERLDGFPAAASTAAWSAFADYLHELADSVLAAAIHSQAPTRPLVIDDGRHRRLEMDEHAVDALTAKLDQHVRLAYLLGFEDAEVTAESEPAPLRLDPEPASTYLPSVDSSSNREGVVVDALGGRALRW